MPITLDDLEEAGFPKDNWPDDLPMPGENNIRKQAEDGTQERYRFEVEVDGQRFGMEVDLDTATVPDPAEGVSFMLNQFAFLWRSDKSEVAVDADGSVRRINF